MDKKMITNGLKRRNSVPAVVIPERPNSIHNNHNKSNKFNLGNLSPSPPTLPSVDFELVSLKFPPSAASYTSLKDIMSGSSPPTFLSPPPANNITGSVAGAGAGVMSPSAGSGYGLSIRNHLVKQAAWAYLQPAVSSSSPSSPSRRLCFSGEFYGSMIARFRQVTCETVTRVYDWLVDVLWLILCR